MPMGLLFWILMLFWLLWGAWWRAPNYTTWFYENWLLFIIIFLLGWHDFGPPIR